MAALVLLIAGPGLAENGVREARAAARVSVSIPSLHGADIPSRPADPEGVAFARNVSRQGTGQPLPELRVMSSNGDAAIQLVRRVRGAPAVAASSSHGGRAPSPEVVSTATLNGATGWTALRDELETPAMATASNGGRRVTVIYEVWPF